MKAHKQFITCNLIRNRQALFSNTKMASTQSKMASNLALCTARYSVVRVSSLCLDKWRLRRIIQSCRRTQLQTTRRECTTSRTILRSCLLIPVLGIRYLSCDCRIPYRPLQGCHFINSETKFDSKQNSRKTMKCQP